MSTSAHFYSDALVFNGLERPEKGTIVEKNERTTLKLSAKSSLKTKIGAKKSKRAREKEFSSLRPEEVQEIEETFISNFMTDSND